MNSTSIDPFGQLRQLVDSQLSVLVGRAISFVQSQSYPINVSRLSDGKPTFFHAEKEWIKTTLFSENPAAAQKIKPGDILFSIQFCIADDLNCLEVIFHLDEPILIDYH
ncbi:MAG: hypothetical protein HC904_07350 [Blastochloris sp.]|nr:hypothetical protein [Blastochloris sp.]